MNLYYITIGALLYNIEFFLYVLEGQDMGGRGFYLNFGLKKQIYSLFHNDIVSNPPPTILHPAVGC